MQTIRISTTYQLKWMVKGHEHYVVSPCGKVFNRQRGKMLKRAMNGCTPGYYIASKFYTLKQLREMLVPLPDRPVVRGYDWGKVLATLLNRDCQDGTD